ncbi:unnamed protein product [Musa textilis]
MLLVQLSLLCAAVASASDGGGGNRRVLHQPLYPVQWTPPPPPQEFLDPPPDASDAAATSSGPSASSASKKIIAVAASASAVALVVLVLLGLLLYRLRRADRSPDAGKLTGRDDSGGRREGRSASSEAAQDLLYPGTMETVSTAALGWRQGSESNGSPHRRLGLERVLEMHHPSPELQPLPPLTAMASREVMVPLPMASSDEDTFYTAQRSLASATSGSPSSPVSRRSLPSMSSGGKEFLVAAVAAADSAPRSVQLTTYSKAEVRQIIPPMKRQPPPPAPPPPPPPPPPPTTDKFTRNPRPPPPPPPIKAPAAPIAPSSRRRLLNPLPPEAARFNIPLPPAKVGNEVAASSSRQIEEAGEDLEGDAKPKLKPLHWDKVRASSDRAMVWDQLKSSSFQVNEDVIQTLFVNNTTACVPKDASRRRGILPFKRENRVLDPKKSQNIAILLRALKVTTDEVYEALLDGNPECLGAELLETLVKMAPTKEEELRLRDYTGDVSKLGLAERFLKTVLDIPFAFKRVDAMLYRATFETEVNYLMKSFETLEAACEDLRSSRLFRKLLEAVLRTGNRMNVGTNRGQAKAFKLDTLLKLADVGGTDGKTTLLHFVLQEIIRSEGSGTEPTTESLSDKVREEQFKKQGLKVVAGLSSELGNVRKAAGMDSDVISGYVSKLEIGLEKIRSVLELAKSCTQGMNFYESLKKFLEEAEREIDRVKVEEKRVMSLVKETTEYFHGNAAKEEAHPLRIFTVVRDFLAVLDNVCKEAGRLHERTVVGSARSFHTFATALHPVLRRWGRDANSDEDSS